jgi:hypothetical protein
MSNLTEIINNLTNFFNTHNIKFVIAGGVAINYLCDKCSINNNFEINNLDIFYLANTPIAATFIGDYWRIQNSPCRSATYKTKDNFNINLTMTRTNNMRYIQFNNMKIMHPNNLISYYNDDIIINLNKINVLKKIIDSVSDETILYINKVDYLKIDNESRASSNGEPLARRLFVGN